MRILLIASAAALALSAAACTEAQREDAGEEAAQATDAAGEELKEAVESVDLEAAAEKTRDVASNVGDAVQDAAGDVKEGVDRAGEETRDEAGDAGRAADNAADDVRN
jgi:gas vesicle protein